MDSEFLLESTDLGLQDVIDLRALTNSGAAAPLGVAQRPLQTQLGLARRTDSAR